MKNLRRGRRREQWMKKVISQNLPLPFFWGVFGESPKKQKNTPFH